MRLWSERAALCPPRCGKGLVRVESAAARRLQGSPAKRRLLSHVFGRIRAPCVGQSSGCSCRPPHRGSTAQRRGNSCESRMPRGAALLPTQSSKHISGSRMRSPFCSRSDKRRWLAVPSWARLVHRLDDQLHVGGFSILRYRPWCQPPACLRIARMVFISATRASSASGIVSAVADDSNAARMTAEVC